MKRIYELSVVVTIFFIVIYFLLYTFLFDSMCIGFRNTSTVDSKQIISEISNCKDSLVCEMNDIEVDEKNNITTWSCNKKVNKYFEFDFYKDSIRNIYNNILNKF